MPPVELTTDMMLVFGIIGIVIFLFLVEWVRVDVVAILAMVTLPMLGLLRSQEAFSGFSSNAVISIIAVIIMGRGLDHTGVINRVVRPLIKMTGNRRGNIISLLSIVIAFISSVMQNIGAAALFLPALRRISKQSRVSLSQLLMPVGFAAILGGTITLVGSSPLIMLNDLLAPFGVPPFGLFSVMPVGVALVVAGIVYFIFFGRWLLPKSNGNGEEYESDVPGLEKYYEGVGELHELVYPATKGADPIVSDLCDKFQVHTVIVDYPHGGLKVFPPSRDAVIQAGAVMAVYGTEEQVQAAAMHYGFNVRPELQRFATDLSSDYSGVAEGVVSPHSQFIGRTLADIHFRHRYLVAPLAVFRRHHAFYSKLGRLRLMPGDAILMHGGWEHFQAFRRTRDLIFSHSLDHEHLHPQKSLLALGWFGIATALVLFSGLPLPVCLMAGAVGMIITGVITIDEAYHGVDWRTVFLLAGLIPLGIATEKTGAANWLAYHILNIVGSPPEPLFLFIVALITTVFTLVISNVGAAVLLVPLVVNLALKAGYSPALAALMVGIAASNSFMLPTHQVNALYMGPGHYTSRDFLKVGAPLSLIFIIVVTAMLSLFY